MFESFIGHVYGDGLLADSVDRTISIIVVQLQQMWCWVKCTISERAENSKHANIGYIFRVCGEKIRGRIAFKFCLVIGTQDVITSIKFGDDQLSGYWLACAKVRPFS